VAVAGLEARHHEVRRGVAGGLEARDHLAEYRKNKAPAPGTRGTQSHILGCEDSRRRTFRGSGRGTRGVVAASLALLRLVGRAEGAPLLSAGWRSLRGRLTGRSDSVGVVLHRPVRRVEGAIGPLVRVDCGRGSVSAVIASGSPIAQITRMRPPQ